MSKQQFESNIKPIPYAQSCVYAKLADLNNLAVIKERFNDPSVRAMMSGQVPEDKLNQLNERIQEMTFDTDSVSCNISPLGEVSLRIIEREEPKCIKFETVNSPHPSQPVDSTVAHFRNGMQDETDGRSRPQPVHQRYGGQTAERGCRETGGHVGHDSIRS